MAEHFSQILKQQSQNINFSKQRLKNVIRWAFEKTKILFFSISSINLNQSQSYKNSFQIAFSVKPQSRFDIIQTIYLDRQHLTIKFSYKQAQINDYFKNPDTILNSSFSKIINEKSLIGKIFTKRGSVKIEFNFVDIYDSQEKIKKHLKQSLQNFLQIHEQILEHTIFAPALKKGLVNVNDYEQKFSISAIIIFMRLKSYYKGRIQKKEDYIAKLINFLQIYESHSKSGYNNLVTEYNQNYEAIKQRYQKELYCIKEKIQKNNKNKDFRIVNSITVIVEKKINLMSETRENIYKVYCKYHNELTSNYFANQKVLCNQMHKTIPEENSQRLVMKRKIKEEADNSKAKNQKRFQNELKFIYKHRDQSCSSIAKYYLDRMKIDGQCKYWLKMQKFYLREYKCTLQQKEDQIKKQLKTIIRIMYRTMLGIKFLYDKNLLHHDIKKQNIMLDDGLNPKLIDFEGVNKEYVKQQEDKCKLKQPTYHKLMTHTKGYYIAYGDLQPEIKKKYPTKESYQFHALYDVYSYGQVFSLMINYLPFRQRDQEYEFIRIQLQGIFFRCIQPDPEKRITPDQCLIMLSLIEQKMSLSLHKNKTFLMKTTQLQGSSE